MSEPKVIAEENKDEIKAWFDEAKNQTFDTLPEFIRHVMNDYAHDYGTVCHAISACTVATAWACNRMEGARGGITGFQAGFVMWGFIKHWQYESNKTGLRIVDYDNLLFPQYASYFQKTISPDIWQAVQKEAKRRYDDACASFNAGNGVGCADAVFMHWKRIKDGNLPFGLKVSEE